MKRLIFFILAWGPIAASGQEDTASRQQDVPVAAQPRITFTEVQIQWLSNHFKTISGIGDDSAARVIRNAFPGLNEPTVAALISEAGRMMRSDKQEQLSRLRSVLDGQRHEKQALLKRITEK